MSLVARLASLPTIALGLAIAFSPSNSRADTTHTFALDRLAPSDAGSAWISGDDLDLRGWMRLMTGVTTSWADRPLDVYDATGTRQGVVVSRQIVTSARLSILACDGLRFGVVLPWVASGSGGSSSIGGRSIAAPAPDGLGDLRLSAIGNLWTRETTTVAWSAVVWLPTGSAAAYATDGSMRLQPGARAAGSIGEWSWAAQGWATFRPTNETMRGATIGSEVGVGASFGRRFLDEKWLAGIEANAARVLISGSDGPTTATVEAMAELRATVADGLTIHGGAGLGILRGAGTPDWRTVLTIDWHPDPTPTTPTPKLDAARTGCAGDAERAHAITQSESDEGASVASVTRERRTPSAPVAAIEEDRIVVTSAATPGSTEDAIDDVLFDNDRSVLLPASTATIAAVARVIAEHPEIKLVRVDGHADSRADEAHNEALSEARAAAVIDGLIRAGVDRRRLTSAAHGSREPITTNATEAGRARNRRVTFTLVETRP